MYVAFRHHARCVTFSACFETPRGYFQTLRSTNSCRNSLHALNMRHVRLVGRERRQRTSLFVSLAATDHHTPLTESLSPCNLPRTRMPAMTTPLKALIQERLRAKIVRRGDEEYDYDVGMYSPPARSQPLRRGYASHETKDRSIASSMPSNAAHSVGGSSSSLNAGFPLRLHTEIDPAAYIPHGQQLSARGYGSHHGFAVSPSFKTPDHRSLHHEHHISTQYRRDDDDYRDGNHTISRSHRTRGIDFDDISPRWTGPPRDVMCIDSPSPIRHQASSSLHHWEKNGVPVHHHTSELHRYKGAEVKDNNKNRHKHSSPSSFHKVDKDHRREPRLSYSADPRSASMRNDNQAWHDVCEPSEPKSPNDRHHTSSQSTREAERVYTLDHPQSMPMSLSPSRHYTRHHHQRLSNWEPHGRHHPPEINHQSRHHRSNVPKPLDMGLVACSHSKIRTLDQVLSPESRLAANAFVEKRQKRSDKSTPRTIATQRWLRSLDVHNNKA